MQSSTLIFQKFVSTSIRLRLINTSRHVPFSNRIPQNCLRLSDVPLLLSIVRAMENAKPLQDYTILNIQHQLGDVSAQTEALIRLGASPSDLYFLPPAYTHHNKFELFVHEYLKVPKENFFQSSSYRLRYNYDKYRLIQVISQLKQMIEMELKKERMKNNHLLVLDDGGCFPESLAILFDIADEKLDPNQFIENLPFGIKKSNAEFLLSYLRSIDTVVVEQTSRGLFKYFDQPKIAIATSKLRIPIIDVATSEPKKRFEPSIIAEACLNMLSYLFYDAPKHLTISKPDRSHKCLLLGYGAIGQAIAYALTHQGDLGMFSRNSVQVWDRDEMKNKLAEDDGFEIFHQWNNHEEFDYIIGCAGRCSLPISSLSLLRHHSYLISVSSAAIEFPFHQMIEYALNNHSMNISLSNEDFKQLDDENIHRNIQFTIANKRHVTVVNGGMPITFLGILNPTHAEKFDLTISCMIAASIQAAYTKRTNHHHQQKQIIPFDSNYAEMICHWFENNRT